MFNKTGGDRMRRYIDFDGVVVDTSPLLFKEWQQMKY